MHGEGAGLPLAAANEAEAAGRDVRDEGKEGGEEPARAKESGGRRGKSIAYLRWTTRLTVGHQ